jgi:SAM-dependent methyltransferase
VSEFTTEFTGERVIPGQVNNDLWAEHLARYAFAQGYADRRSLDIGCGAGYGVAQLAQRGGEVWGIDIANEAIAYARAAYPLANVRFARASATAIPFGDSSFDLITAFEVIEHLTDWRKLLSEARRLLTPDGVFLVSTPNKRYYSESRAEHGPNPFHVHEFEYADFHAALAEFFPSVNVLLQNWSPCFAFTPAQDITLPLDARLDPTSPSPDDAHFFLAVCSASSPALRSFLYMPQAANVLRDREHHIHRLEEELAQSKQWLETTIAERNAIINAHDAQKLELEERNRWALQLEHDWKATLDRVAQVQNELQTAQARATEVAGQYARKVTELEDENLKNTDWALEIERSLSAKGVELAQTVRLLDTAEATVVERTEWAQRLRARVEDLEEQMQVIRQSGWAKLGGALRLGPRVKH